jgi:hypothetical protein
MDGDEATQARGFIGKRVQALVALEGGGVENRHGKTLRMLWPAEKIPSGRRNKPDRKFLGIAPI